MTEKGKNELLVSQIPAANLAYLGDSVYEICVREYLVRHGARQPSVESLRYVTAKVQSGVMEKILPLLTEEEEAQYKRGRNLGHSNTPKSSTVLEYRRATGLEALFGWLYLSGRDGRVKELFGAAFDGLDGEDERGDKKTEENK